MPEFCDRLTTVTTSSNVLDKSFSGPVVRNGNCQQMFQACPCVQGLSPGSVATSSTLSLPQGSWQKCSKYLRPQLRLAESECSLSMWSSYKIPSDIYGWTLEVGAQSSRQLLNKISKWVLKALINSSVWYVLKKPLTIFWLGFFIYGGKNILGWLGFCKQMLNTYLGREPAIEVALRPPLSYPLNISPDFSLSSLKWTSLLRVKGWEDWKGRKEGRERSRTSVGF